MRITSKGQITIPSEIRERTGLQPNSEVILEVEGNTVRIRPAHSEDEPKEAQRSMSRSLSEEPFVGMWRDREDMANSTEWVRQAREREWDRR
jgi:AbrB family looped-hinge helix DNA binding protein